MSKKFKLGIPVKDKITDFEGIITGVASYLTGCDQYLIQPPAKDGEYKDGRWFDEGRLKETKKKKISKKSVKGDDNGCDYIAPIK